MQSVFGITCQVTASPESIPRQQADSLRRLRHDNCLHELRCLRPELLHWVLQEPLKDESICLPHAAPAPRGRRWDSCGAAEDSPLREAP